jgi:hypothetical protein
MKTAVEWLINELHKKQNGDCSDLSYNKMFDKAKEMEKQQIIDAITIGFHEGSSYMDNGTTKFETALEYYNETFKSK